MFTYSVFDKYRAKGYRAAVSSVGEHKLTKRHVQIVTTFIFVKNYIMRATQSTVFVSLTF